MVLGADVVGADLALMVGITKPLVGSIARTTVICLGVIFSVTAGRSRGLPRFSWSSSCAGWVVAQCPLRQRSVEAREKSARGAKKLQTRGKGWR